MVLNLITLGIKLLLKTYCQKIKIIRIKLLIKNNKFRGNIEKLLIEAEDIIYKDIFLKHVQITGFNLNIDFSKTNKLIKLKEFQAETNLYLTTENLKNIINKNCSDINNKIKEFAVQNSYINNISFDNKLINFDILKGEKQYKFIYDLKFEDNNLILDDINSKKYFLIPFDQNIIFKSLSFDKDYLKVKLKSIVKFEN